MNTHKQLVFVNSSASLAYVEVPLDRHVLIKATGNVGKSSILNAFKLCWLPETNFTACERKFKFISRQADSGFYNGDDAFNHYFPTNRSYLILECENIHGEFCQILYPRPNRSYGRIFVNAPYSNIEHLFWNKDAGEDGLGSPNNDLSTTGITAYLKGNNIEFETVTAKERLCQLLYSDSVIDSDSQYSVFPLKNQDRQSIKTFCSLVHAMCGAKSDNKELVGMFASIIEGQKVDQNDVLSLDLEKIMVERDELDRESASLTHLEMNRVDAECAISSYDTASSLTSIGSRFVSVRDSLEEEMSALIKKSEELSEEKSNEAQVVRDLRSSSRDKQMLANSLGGELTAIRRGHTVLKKKIDAGKAVLDEFDYDDIKERGTDAEHHSVIIELINEDTSALKEELDILENKEKTANKIRSLVESESAKEEKVEVYKTQLKNVNNLLVNSLTEHSKTTLLSIDHRFSAISRGDLSAGDVGTIDAFCSLFTLNGTKAGMCGVPFNSAKPVIRVEEIEHGLELLADELHDIKGQLKSLKNEDVEFKNSTIKALRENISKNDTDIGLLNTYGEAVKDLPERKMEVLRVEAACGVANRQLGEINKDLSEAIEGGKALGAKLDDVKCKSASIRALKERLDQCRHTPCFNDLIVGVKQEQLLSAGTVTCELIDDIARGFGRFQEAFSATSDKLSKLALNGLIVDEERVLFSSSVTLSMQTPFINEVKSKLEQVEPRRKVLSDNFNAHKAIISMKMQELRGNARAISSYKSRINRMFENFKINNLTGVQIDLILDPRFKNLLEQADRTDLESDSSINGAFYERLNSFITSFFKGGDKELTIEKIIKSVVFKTKKGDGEWLETGQSNSSVSLIVIPLIQSLMADMLNTDVGYKIPMQVDEVAHIDPSQIQWLLDMLDVNGFTLLGASTHNVNAQTLIAINAELNLGELRVQKAYSKERDLVLFGGIEGELL